jgi:hypothetical protein
VLPGSQSPATTPIIFPEVASGLLPANVAVDHNGTAVLATPVSTAGVPNALLVPGVIPFNTPFESYLFHFDPADSTSPGAGNFYGPSTITFTNKILGVQLFATNLNSGDAVIAAAGGPPAAYYPNGVGFRGTEEDNMAISADGLTITLAGQANGQEIDQVRIFVAVPEPSMALLGAMGLLGLFFSCITRIGRSYRA